MLKKTIVETAPHPHNGNRPGRNCNTTSIEETAGAPTQEASD
jgi:hypothetical protein